MKCTTQKRLIFSALTAFTIAMYSNSSLAERPAENITADMGYVSLPSLPEPGDAPINSIRLAALKQAAMSLGARGGLSWESKHINDALKKESIFLDQTFDFNQLLLQHNVLPPVLVESNNNLNLADDNTLRIAAKTYKIVQPARFVTAPPNWRNYLWMSFKKPALPDQSLLPKSPAEARAWNRFLKAGWENGLHQADAIFSANLSRLKRDITGIVLYRQLLTQKMVSAPFVAKAQLGVTGDATQLRIDDQVLRITAQSQLQPNAKKWVPVITK